MQSIIIKYGDSKFEVGDPVVLPYLIDTIMLSDEQIKKDTVYITKSNKIRLSHISICIISNNINWVKKLIELGYEIEDYHIKYAVENKDGKISFKIVKILIDAFSNIKNSGLLPTLILFFERKQKPDDWVYFVNKIGIENLLKEITICKKMLNSYDGYDNLKETDPAYLLIAEMVKYCADKNSLDGIKNIYDIILCKQLISQNNSETELKKELDNNKKELDELKIANSKLKSENDDLKMVYEKLKAEVQQFNILQTKYNDLESELEKVKASADKYQKIQELFSK